MYYHTNILMNFKRRIVYWCSITGSNYKYTMLPVIIDIFCPKYTIEIIFLNNFCNF